MSRSTKILTSRSTKFVQNGQDHEDRWGKGAIDNTHKRSLKTSHNCQIISRLDLKLSGPDGIGCDFRGQ